MFARLLALFVVVPAVELYLLLQLGTVIGALDTFLIIFVTGLVGSLLAKTQGLSLWMRLQKKLATGSIPSKELLDGAIILVSGALLITPGVLTDFVGLLGLFPLSRTVIREAIKERLSARIVSGAFQFQQMRRTRANNGYSGSASGENAIPSDESPFVSGTAKRRPGKTSPS